MKKIKYKFIRSFDAIIAEFKSKGSKKAFNKLFNIIFSQFKKIYYRTKFRIKNIEIINNPYEVIEVPVDLINYKLTNTPPIIYHRPFIKKGVKHHGIILDGNWDKNLKKFEEISDYKAFKQRYQENKKWEETVYYNIFIKNKIFRDFKNWNNILENHLFRWDKLYYDIKNNGYKKQSESKNNKISRPEIQYRDNENKPINEVKVCISRNGEIIHYDGKHRLAIAKLLKLKTIPVIVVAWHKEFIDKIKNKKGLRNISPQIAINYLIKENSSHSTSHTN